MSLSTLTDDWLQDIFIYLDILKQCQLRRCCRRWKRLLSTGYTYRTPIIHLPLRGRPRGMRKKQWRALPVGLTAMMKQTNTAPKGVTIQSFPGLVGTTESKIMRYLSACISGPLDRLILANVHVTDGWVCDSKLLTGRLGLGQLELRNVTFDGSVMTRVLIDYMYRVGPRVESDHSIGALIGSRGVYIPDDDVEAPKELQVLVVGLYVQTVNIGSDPEVAEHRRFSELATAISSILAQRMGLFLMEQMAPLNEEQLREMTVRLCAVSRDSLHRQLTAILRHFARNSDPGPNLDLDTVDFGRLSPVVSRLLYLWDGK